MQWGQSDEPEMSQKVRTKGSSRLSPVPAAPGDRWPAQDHPEHRRQRKAMSPFARGTMAREKHSSTKVGWGRGAGLTQNLNQPTKQTNKQTNTHTHTYIHR
jgi:hypothetical protein